MNFFYGLCRHTAPRNAGSSFRLLLQPKFPSTSHPGFLNQRPYINFLRNQSKIIILPFFHCIKYKIQCNLILSTDNLRNFFKRNCGLVDGIQEGYFLEGHVDCACIHACTQKEKNEGLIHFLRFKENYLLFYFFFEIYCANN